MDMYFCHGSNHVVLNQMFTFRGSNPSFRLIPIELEKVCPLMLTQKDFHAKNNDSISNKEKNNVIYFIMLST